MKVKYDFSHSHITTSEFDAFAYDLRPYINEVRQEIEKQGYQSGESFAELPSDSAYLFQVKEMVLKKNFAKDDKIFLIGIGGSNLGAKAVAEALGISHKIEFVETVDEPALQKSLNLLEQIYTHGGNAFMILITKSGNTTESIANFSVLAEAFQTLESEHTKRTVVITAKESPLEEYAKEHSYDLLHIPRNVAGRFSVFSAAGLFPLAMAGVNPDELLYGARQAVEASLDEDIATNQALQAAVHTYLHFQQGVKVHNSFIFSTQLLQVGYWYRQLMGETLGKDGQGMLPLVSLGTTDLHSVLQYYLAGSLPIFTTFVSVDSNSSSENFRINELGGLDKLIPGISNNTVGQIQSAILQGVKESYIDSNQQFLSINIDEINAKSVEYLMQTKMMQVIYLAKLMNVTAFDQPAVEDYKEKARQYMNPDG